MRVAEETVGGGERDIHTTSMYPSSTSGASVVVTLVLFFSGVIVSTAAEATGWVMRRVARRLAAAMVAMVRVNVIFRS